MSISLLRAAVAACLLALAGAPALATTVLPLSLPELTRDAALIFQGRVVDSRVEEADGLIYTWVRFEAEEVLKGSLPGREFELRFVGGESGGRVVQVAELNLPPEGEHGIYFVESTEPGLVNPLLGWWQGHYRIERGTNGEELLRNVRGEWPATVDPAQQVEAMKSGRSAQLAKPLTGPVHPEDFKSAVRRLLEDN